MQAGSIQIGPYGDLTLIGNSASQVVLQAVISSSCAAPSAVSRTTSVYANLDPAELDVDVGERFGLQVQSQVGKTATPALLQNGQSFNMDVRVNAVSSPLVAFQVRLMLCWQVPLLIALMQAALNLTNLLESSAHTQAEAVAMSAHLSLDLCMH